MSENMTSTKTNVKINVSQKWLESKLKSLAYLCFNDFYKAQAKNVPNLKVWENTV